MYRSIVVDPVSITNHPEVIYVGFQWQSDGSKEALEFGFCAEFLRGIGPSANRHAHLRYTRTICKLPPDYFWATLTDEGFLGHTSVHPLGWLIWLIGVNPPQESIGSRHSC
jgi:hypothetical protein